MQRLHTIMLILLSALLSTTLSSQASFEMLGGTATGAGAAAIGDGTTASGDASLAIGLNTSALKNYSFATGNNSIANGIGATAIGLNTSAQGDYSFSLGQGTSAGGFASVAIGQGANTVETGFAAVAIGSSSAQSPFSFAVGINNIARPGSDGAAIFGGGNVSHAASALVTGAENTAYSFGETIVGQYSVPDPDGTPSASAVPTDRLFTVGNGDNSSNRSNALVMLKNGDTDMTGNLTLAKRLTVGEDTLAVDGAAGQIRYNTDTEDIEGYAQDQWHSLTGLSGQSVGETGDWTTETEAFGATAAAFLKNNDVELNQFMYNSNNNIMGESLFSGLTNATDVLSFDWDISADVGIVTGSSSANPARFASAEVIISARNPSTVQLAQSCAAGNSFDDLIVEVYTSSIPPELITKYDMRNVSVQAVEFFLAEDDEQELVRASLVFQSIEITQIIEKSTGAREEVQPRFIWNQVTNQANH